MNTTTLPAVLPQYQRMANAVNRATQPVGDHCDRETGQRNLVDFTGRNLGPVSKSYAVVQNRDIITPFVKRFGIEAVKKCVEYGAGKYIHVEIETGRAMGFSYNGQSDEIRERLIIENSYNKSRSFRFMFGAFRKVCANGMYTGYAFSAIRRIHSGNVDAPGLVANALGQWEQSAEEGKDAFDLWRDFQNRPMSLDEERELVAKFTPFDPGTDESPNLTARKTAEILRYVAFSKINAPESLDNQRNAWGLLNGLNWAIQKTLKGKSALPRLISANLEAENLVKRSLTS